MTDDTLAATLSKTFIARGDVKAVQQKNGAYHPDRSKFTFRDMRDHLEGRKTFGHYLISADDQCKFFCLDIDLVKKGGWFVGNEWVEGNPREAWAAGVKHPARPYLTEQLRTLSEGLALRIKRLLDIPAVVAYSGNKGVHVYGLSGLVPAADARGAAIDLLEGWGCLVAVRGDNFFRHIETDPHCGFPSLEIEVFPKQDSLEGKDLGNLLRLPLGINQKSGEAGYFVEMRSPYNKLPVGNPGEILKPGYTW